MPRFYLHLLHDGILIEDPDGSELPDAGAARAEALTSARELWALAMHNGTDLSDRRFVIRDEEGRHLIEVPFTDALPQGLRKQLLR